MKERHRAWTEEEEKYLIENYKKVSIGEIENHLDRTQGSIYGKISNLRSKSEIIELPREKKKWTMEEETFIINNYEKMTTKDIAKKLKVTSVQVDNKVNSLRNQGIITFYKNDSKKIRPLSKRKREQLRSQQERDAIDNIAYLKLVNEPVKAGLKLNDVKLQLGQVYKVATPRKKDSPQGIFKGVMIQETKNHVTLKNKAGRCETFLKVDLLLKEYEIKEVS